MQPLAAIMPVLPASLPGKDKSDLPTSPVQRVPCLSGSHICRAKAFWCLQDKRCYELDFGPVPVGQRVTRSIDLFNQVGWKAQPVLNSCITSFAGDRTLL